MSFNDSSGDNIGGRGRGGNGLSAAERLPDAKNKFRNNKGKKVVFIGICENGNIGIEHWIGQEENRVR